MPYRPMREKEKTGQLEKISKVEEDIEELTKYLQRLEAELKEGVWYS